MSRGLDVALGRPIFPVDIGTHHIRVLTPHNITLPYSLEPSPSAEQEKNQHGNGHKNQDQSSSAR
jgi:hypothetical protein